MWSSYETAHKKTMEQEKEQRESRRVQKLLSRADEYDDEYDCYMVTELLPDQDFEVYTNGSWFCESPDLKQPLRGLFRLFSEAIDSLPANLLGKFIEVDEPHCKNGCCKVLYEIDQYSTRIILCGLNYH